jgi:hypothetical protein
MPRRNAAEHSPPERIGHDGKSYSDQQRVADDLRASLPARSAESWGMPALTAD